MVEVLWWRCCGGGVVVEVFWWEVLWWRCCGEAVEMNKDVNVMLVEVTMEFFDNHCHFFTDNSFIIVTDEAFRSLQQMTTHACELTFLTNQWLKFNAYLFALLKWVLCCGSGGIVVVVLRYCCEW